MDGSLRKVLLDKNVQNPRGIAVNPELGLVKGKLKFLCYFTARNSTINISSTECLDIYFGQIGTDKILE